MTPIFGQLVVPRCSMWIARRSFWVALVTALVISILIALEITLFFWEYRIDQFCDGGVELDCTKRHTRAFAMFLLLSAAYFSPALGIFALAILGDAIAGWLTGRRKRPPVSGVAAGPRPWRSWRLLAVSLVAACTTLALAAAIDGAGAPSRYKSLMSDCFGIGGPQDWIQCRLEMFGSIAFMLHRLVIAGPLVLGCFLLLISPWAIWIALAPGSRRNQGKMP